MRGGGGDGEGVVGGCGGGGGGLGLLWEGGGDGGGVEVSGVGCYC